MTCGERVAARAMALVGTAFRLHGREAARGLDCVGVAALAIGPAGEVATGYALRSGDVERAKASLRAAGLVEGAEARTGDILLVDAGAGQLHLAVKVEGGVVHADAGLRRTVFRPGPPPWTMIACWRSQEGEE